MASQSTFVRRGTTTVFTFDSAETSSVLTHFAENFGSGSFFSNWTSQRWSQDVWPRLLPTDIIFHHELVDASSDQAIQGAMAEGCTIRS